MESDTVLSPSVLPSLWSEIIMTERSSAVSEERRRFANELHDIVANHLNGTTLFLAAARQALPLGEIRDLVDAADKGVRECWSDARRCAQGLRPLCLERRGLVRVLSAYAARMSAASEISITFNPSGTPTPLSEDTELALLRVTEEAVTNAVRHAGARTVSIEFTFGAEGHGLKISDDGAGLDLTRAPVGIGLLSMRERAQKIGGELTILSRLNVGTQVILTIPSDAVEHSQPETYLG